MTRAAISALEPRDLERLDQLLEAFNVETRARCSLLLDRAGRLLSVAGETEALDRTAFASLAAADFAASDRLAELLGEQEFSSLYHQGEQLCMYLVDVGRRAILAVLFDSRTTLGLVRLKIRGLVPQLDTLFSAMAERPRTGAPELEEGWVDDVVDEIDRLFAE
ncbi:MAG: roadblock/LC7 domain-containing protein [Gemmatimonadetes bacterium]|nr:roadblock/LC7 domain-containing protein [Gemmatimonadota bacterium]